MRSPRDSTGSRSASEPTRSKARVSRSGARSTTSPTRCPAGSRSRPTRDALARYAAICQDEGVVPIVEPEVLMDGDHTLERCAEVTEAVLHEVFDALHRNRVVLEHMLLKPSMVVAGKEQARQAPVVEVAAQTVRVLRRTRAGGRAGHLLLVRRADARRGDRPSRRDQPARAAALGAELLIWARAAGAGVARLERAGRQCSQRPGRVARTSAIERRGARGTVRLGDGDCRLAVARDANVSPPGERGSAPVAQGGKSLLFLGLDVQLTA